MEEQKMKKLWDNYKVIGEVQKSDKIKQVVGAGIRDGARYLVTRELYYRKKDDSWQPGKGGITVPLEVPINNGTERIEPYKHLINLMAKAAVELRAMELSDPEHAVYTLVKPGRFSK